MKILNIQPFNGQLHAIMSEGDPIPVDKIEGNPTKGSQVEYDGIGWAVTIPQEIECGT